MITKNPRVHFKLTDEELSGIERLRKAVAAQRAVERQIPLPSRARNDPPPAGRMPFMSDSTLAHACLLHEMEQLRFQERLRHPLVAAGNVVNPGDGRPALK
jgi:hypothetical protein